MPINYYCDVEVQSNVLTTDVSNSRVGVNLNAPLTTLHVDGTIRAGGSSSSSTRADLSSSTLAFRASSTTYGTAFIFSNTFYINTGTSGGTLYIGAPASNTTNLNVQGTGTFQTISNAISDTDKFLVSDSGTIKYRTGAEVRADIGAGTGDGTVTGTGSSARVAFWNGASSLTSDSEFVWNSTNNYLGIGAGSSPQSPLHVQSTLTDDIVRIVGISGGKPQINIYEGTNNVGRIVCTGSGSFDFSNLASGVMTFSTGGTYSMTIASNGTVSIAGGSLILNGTGRIQGVDTVSASTDAANKAYVDAHVPTTTQTILNSNFLDTIQTSTLPILRIPFNTLTETSSNQYYNNIDCPTDGSVKRFRIQNTYGTMSTSFTTELMIFKNGSTTPTSSGELSIQTDQSGGNYVSWDPSNYTFEEGDKLQFAFQKSAFNKTWSGVSASIIIEFNQV